MPANKKMIMPLDVPDIQYAPETTPALFHASDEPIRGIMGPVGSGKSVACVMEILMRCREQRPHQGIRRSRWAIIRNTYPELISTSMNTWKDWVPSYICNISMASPITGHLNMPLGDGTRVEAEIYFLALDKDEDIRKLKSLELTGAWINEASEVPKAVLDMAILRIDRFPSKKNGGPSWTGVIMDTNPPDTDSWWHSLAEEKKPHGYRFFNQPPALLLVPNSDPPEYVPNEGQGYYPPAENICNHNSGYRYYLRAIHGQTQQWISVFILGQYGTVSSGKPVFPEYNDAVHCAKTAIEPYRGLPLILGWDFGLTPAVAICQLSPRGQFRVLEELVSEDMGIRTFGRDIVRPVLVNKYGGMLYASKGDPAGNSRSQTTEVTCLQELNEIGIPTSMARTNEFVARREAVAGFLQRMMDGQPCFLLSPTCKVLRKGFNGMYCFAKLRMSGEDRFKLVPEKNRYSHPHDGLQYAALEAEGGGGMDPYRGTMAGGKSAHRPGGDRREVSIEDPASWT
jgi:hypothetical protein